MKFINFSKYSLVAKRISVELAEISPKTVREFFRLIMRYRSLEQRESEITKQKEIIKEELIKFPPRFPELAGLQTSDNLRTTLKFTPDKISWQKKPMKRALGSAYSEIVHEDLVLTISLSDEKRQQELLYILEKYFGTRKKFKAHVSENWNLRIDEELLEKMVREKRVRLPKSAQKVVRQGFWSIITQRVKE